MTESETGVNRAELIALRKVASFSLWEAGTRGRQPSFEGGHDFGRDKLAELALEPRELTDKRAADVGEAFLGEKEHGFDRRIKAQVHERHRKLVVHVAQGA